MSSSFFKPLAGLFLLCLSLAPGRLAAQEPPQLLIASIVVEGVSQPAARKVAAAETLLQPGRTYTEREVRLGVYRVRRLRFVVNADFTLQKRNEGDGYDLVIHVIEETPVFLTAGTSGERLQQEDFLTGKKRTTTSWQQFGVLGGRTFVGSSGVAEGSVEKLQHQDGELVQAGYTQYDLFGAGTAIGGALDSTQGARGYDQVQASLFGTLPLTAAQSLQTSLSWGRFEQSLFDDTLKTLTMTRGADVVWVYNTTDDPLFTMRGSYGFAGWSYRRDTGRETDSFQEETLSRRFALYRRGIRAGLAHYFPVTARQSLYLAADVDREKAVSDGVRSGPWQWTVSVGHSIHLLGGERTHRFGDLYWNNSVAATYFYSDATSTSRSLSSRDASFVSSLGYRSRWGVLRATFTYAGLWRSH